MATLAKLLDALLQAEAARKLASDLGQRSMAGRGAVAGSAEAVFAIHAHRVRGDAAAWLSRAAAIPGFDNLKTVCIAQAGAFDAAAVRRLAARAAMAAGETLDAFLARESGSAVEILAGRTAPATPSEQASDLGGLTPLLAVYAGAAIDGRVGKVAEILASGRTVGEKLLSWDAVLPIPASASAAVLARALGVSATAIKRTGWWAKARQGARTAEAVRRGELARARGRTCELPSPDATDD